MFNYIGLSFVANEREKELIPCRIMENRLYGINYDMIVKKVKVEMSVSLTN
jgi:hypothetical protein